jgi:arsenite methyltransferase
LLLIGAARRLTTGHATGIDIWSKDDMAGNSMEATYRNVEIEGVRAKVHLRSENACKMSFPDGAFEVVLSNLCLHNIRDDAARKSACLEIARVLAPGGVALLSDFRHTAQYQHVLESTGLVTCRSAPAIWYTFPPLRTVRAQKPLGKCLPRPVKSHAME